MGDLFFFNFEDVLDEEKVCVLRRYFVSVDEWGVFFFIIGGWLFVGFGVNMGGILIRVEFDDIFGESGVSGYGSIDV